MYSVKSAALEHAGRPLSLIALVLGGIGLAIASITVADMILTERYLSLHISSNGNVVVRAGKPIEVYIALRGSAGQSSPWNWVGFGTSIEMSLQPSITGGNFRVLIDGMSLSEIRESTKVSQELDGIIDFITVPVDAGTTHIKVGDSHKIASFRLTGPSGAITNAEMIVRIASPNASARPVRKPPPFALYVGISLLSLSGACFSAGRVIKQKLRKQRLASGLCLVCGYDLRATIERCPECSTPTSSFTRTGDRKR